MSTAMILCAGFGKRLRPLTDELPKPLVPIGERPLLWHIATRLAERGVRRIVLNVPQQLSKFLKIINSLPIIPRVVIEVDILGTAGGIAASRAALGSAPILVHNGDILTEPPVEQLLASATDGLCMVVRACDCSQGTVGLDDRGRVVRLRGECFGREVRGADYVGVCVLGERCLATLPARGCLVQDWALPELAAGRSITTLMTLAEWVDIGGLLAYLDANLHWLGSRPHFVGARAQIGAGVELDQTIVGEDATVSGTGCLRQCVVWPTARVTAPLTRCVVTSAGNIVKLGD